ncbi:UNVERIFIED_CONTAM: hypothetical protein FKN15_052990 [Acipenser sinensis]
MDLQVHTIGVCVCVCVCVFLSLPLSLPGVAFSVVNGSDLEDPELSQRAKRDSKSMSVSIPIERPPTERPPTERAPDRKSKGMMNLFFKSKLASKAPDDGKQTTEKSPDLTSTQF